MNDKSTNSSFDDDLLNLDDLDQQIEKIHTRPHLIDNIQKAKAEQEKENDDTFSFWGEVKSHWYLYLFLCVSAVFTATLGVYMGLAPSNAVDPATGAGFVHFNTDPLHVFLALLYAVAFVTVTEIAFGIAKHLFYIREDGNKTQSVMMWLMMIAAGISVLFTGYSGGSVIASFIQFMTKYKDVSSLAQEWIVSAIPVLIVIYAFLITPYVLSSDHAKSKRTLREQSRKSAVDHQLRTETMQNYGAELLQKAELKRYIQMVQEGKLTAAEAQAAIRAGLTLGNLEKKTKRDIDKDGAIGEPVRANGHNGNGSRP